MQEVGRYKIERRIGQGAMADVFLAYDDHIDRPLAIKILKKEFRSNTEYVTRFLQESRAAGVMSHPHIVTIYDVGKADGFPYIAMELLNGTPLDTIIEKRGKLPAEEVIKLGRQLASALQYAHDNGIVHRDIKPSNIMVSDDGENTKLLDFGIARLVDADRKATQASYAQTQVGQVLGTPRYMSPEQALGLPLDPRTDLFSLGAVLYEAATGHCAFDGETLVTLALRITQSTPEPIERLVSDCPEGLSFIINKLLSKNADERFPDGASLAKALKREEISHETLGTDGRTRRFPLAVRLSAIFGGATAIALAFALYFILDRQEQALASNALTSGSTITKFVANQAALRTVENAGLDPALQDWIPVQAFITSAAEDTDVQKITVIDGDNIVRASNDATRIGKRYRLPKEPIVFSEDGQAMTSAGDHGLRFKHDINYAGRSFGKIDVVMNRDSFDKAMLTSRTLLYGAGLSILALILLVSFIIAQRLQRPVRTLRNALDDAATGNLDFRISHQRRDEFGELFDRFNTLMESLKDKSSAAQDTRDEPQDMGATIISSSVNRAA